MCGIMGYIGERKAVPILLEGLQRLEYRGYDSAGIAVFDNDGKITIHKTQGKINDLIAAIAIIENPEPAGSIGIGHTRWATHGKPNDVNAHPHTDCSGKVVVIHNGIVENYKILKASLQAQGHIFVSQTDSEVIPHLIEEHLNHGLSFEDATRTTINCLEGAHGILVIYSGEPVKIIAVRIGNAGGVVLGYGTNEIYLASDLSAILPYTQTVAFLNSREMAIATKNNVLYSSIDGQTINKSLQNIPYDPVAAAKSGYRHFMQKEILEQPQTILDCLRSRLGFEPPSLTLEDMTLSDSDIKSIKRVILLGMGTSLHAAMVGRTYIEHIAKLPAEVDNASEFRYREAIIGPETLIIAVGQSGETVDTLAAMEEAKNKGAKLITICNILGSQATRIADAIVFIRAGLEIGVCSTKTFSNSLVAL